MHFVSFEQCKREYRKSIFVLGQFMTLIGNYLLLSFIFPPVNEQGEARDRDIKIGAWLLFAGQLLNFLKESTEPVKHFAEWLSDNSNNPALNAVLENKLSPKLRVINNAEFDRWYRHSRSANFEVGMMLVALQKIITILTASESNTFINWINSNKTIDIATRAFIAAFVTSSVGYCQYKLNQLEQQKILPDVSPLLPSKTGKTQFNKYSRIKYFSNIPYTMFCLLVIASFFIVIIEGFTPEFSNRAALILTETFAGIGFFINSIPDRPLVKVIYPLQWTGRVLDKFFKVGLLRNLPLQFDFQMDFISFMADTLENLVLNNNTALTIGLLNLFPTLHLSEVLYKLTSVLNNSDERLVYPWLSTWDLALASVTAQYWSLETFEANPIAIVAAAITASAAFAANQFEATIEPNSIKKLASQLPQRLNESTCYAGLLLNLCRLTELSLAQKTAVVLPIATIHLGLTALTQRYAVVKRVMQPVEHMLLAYGVGNALQQFLKPFTTVLPPLIVDGVAATVGLSSGLYQLRECLSTISKKKGYEQIKDTAQTSALITSQWSAYFHNLTAAAFFIIGIAAFNKATESLNADEPISTTGNGLLLALLGLNLIIMVRILGYNMFHRNNPNAAKNSQSSDNIAELTTKALRRIGVFKERALIVPASPRMSEHFIPDSPRAIHDANNRAKIIGIQ